MPALTPALNSGRLAREISAALAEFRKIADDSTGPDLDVRLVVDVGDENWWLATGDVQYDTVHGDLCAAGTVHVSMSPVEVRELATELCNEIDSQYADFEDRENACPSGARAE